jgi:hypothetical protein
MRGTALALVLLAGCAESAVEGDWFRLQVGNEWEYFVRNAEEAEERWFLHVKDADDNPDSGRGTHYFLMERTFVDGSNPLIEHTLPMRGFNVAPFYVDGNEDSGTVQSWQYKVVNTDEGDRNEDFLQLPGPADDWTARWSYDLGSGGTDFNFDVTMAWSDEALQTSIGSFERLLVVERVWTSVSEGVGGDELTLVTTRIEKYAQDAGLVSYKVIGSDGVEVEGVVRVATFAE